MAYKTVRRNGRDVLIDTRTGKEVKPGQRLMNELRWAGQGITDNFTYSDKVDSRSGRRLTPAEVRKVEGKKPAAKPTNKVQNSNAASHRAGADAKEVDRLMGELRAENKAKSQQSRQQPVASTSRSSSNTPRTTATTKPVSKPATKPVAPASTKDRRVSAATANRESGNYGTSRTNNPMIDDAMKARMRQREERDGVGPVKDGARYAADVKSNTQGVGPVKDGERYASNVKPSTSTPGKKKEDETKSMSIAERMRRRRAGLA